MARKTRTSIPLDAIPGKKRGKFYTLEFKEKVVAALEEKSATEVQEEFGVSPTAIAMWQKALDPHAATRSALRVSLRERESRLESAAMMVEVEGTRGAEIAMRIRDLIKPRGPTPSYRSAFAHRSELNRGKAGGIASAAKNRKK